MDRFLALSSRVQVNWMVVITTTNIITPNTYPKREIVKGKDRIPAPITVFMMVVTVSMKSSHRKLHTCFGAGHITNEHTPLSTLIATELMRLEIGILVHLFKERLVLCGLRTLVYSVLAIHEIDIILSFLKPTLSYFDKLLKICCDEVIDNAYQGFICSLSSSTFFSLGCSS